MTYGTTLVLHAVAAMGSLPPMPPRFGGVRWYQQDLREWRKRSRRARRGGRR